MASLVRLEGLRGGPDDLSPLRGEDEHRGLPDGLCRRRPDHPSPEVDVRGREPTPLPDLRPGRPARG